jgi:hypothetical protein
VERPPKVQFALASLAAHSAEIRAGPLNVAAPVFLDGGDDGGSSTSLAHDATGFLERVIANP